MCGVCVLPMYLCVRTHVCLCACAPKTYVYVQNQRRIYITKLEALEAHAPNLNISVKNLNQKNPSKARQNRRFKHFDYPEPRTMFSTLTVVLR